MSILENRISKLEKHLMVDDENIVIHRVVWDGEEPTHYLVEGKLYQNDGHIGEAIKADHSDWGKEKCIRVLWEPVTIEGVDNELEATH